MHDDAGTAEEPRSLTGDISPTDPGRWLPYVEAATRWKIQRKAVYRRVRRGQATGRANPDTGEPEVWVPDDPGTTAPDPPAPAEEPRSLAVPDAPERLARVIEQATAPLVARIEELIRENERLRMEQEQRSRQEEQIARQRDDLARWLAERDAELERLRRRPWWRRIMG